MAADRRWRGAAWIGLVPKQNSTGGIAKAGDRSLRRLLGLGASAVVRHHTAPAAESWLAARIARRPRMVAAAARANKPARIAGPLLVPGGNCDPLRGTQRKASGPAITHRTNRPDSWPRDRLA